ncbi:3-hydroxyacyl-[acyl-carrier-protein] dehydratase [Parelusimicrobium proximum]|uniref:hypothetical protein n=1 Tax=Parelusimicrobium proximum TaxID=3228953 RepID=UPI003D16481C
MKTVSNAVKELYTETADGGRFTLPADFPAFDGHFPGEPILPAVVQVQMALYVVSARAGVVHRLKSIKKSKFARPVKAGDTIDIIISEKGENFFEVNVKKGEETASTFQIYTEQI